MTKKHHDTTEPKISFRKQYDFKKFPGLECGPGKTQTHHAEEVNINSIVARFARTGELPERKQVPQYLDLLYAPKSLQEAQDRLIAARQQFMNLPSALREEFRNSPIEFFNQVSKGHPHAIDALRKQGILVDEPASKADSGAAPAGPKDTGSGGAPSKKPDDTAQGT